MKIGRKTYWALGGALLIGLLLIGGWVILATKHAKNPPSEMAGALPEQAVVISSPISGSAYPLNSVIPVRARVQGDDLTILELWADNALIEAQDVTGTGSGRIDWSWTPAAEGLHTLLVRAHHKNGGVTLSNAVQVTITGPVGASSQIEAQQGDTVASIAAAHNVPPEDVHPAQKDEGGRWSVHPPIAVVDDPDAALTPGQPVLVTFTPHFPPSQPKMPVKQPPSPQTPILGARIVDKFALIDADAPPAAPTLTGQVSGCQVMLIFEDAATNEDGFEVLRQAEGETVFTRIASLDKKDSAAPLSFTDPNPVAHAVYVVSAVNGAGESPSNPWGAHISDPTCFGENASGSDGNQGGSVQIIGPKLLLPRPIERGYFYYSTDDGKNWQRAPEDDHQFVVPGEDGKIDFSQLLKPSGPGSGSLAVDVWGWSDGSLSHLGATSQENKQTSLTICPIGCSGDVNTFRVTENTIPWTQESWNVDFEIHNNADEATKFIWQVGITPFPPGPVLQEGLYTKETPPDWSVTLPLPESMRSGGDYFIRLIPFKGNQPVGEPSNQVTLHIDPPTEGDTELYKMEAAYDVKIVEFRPIHWPDPGVCTGAVILDSHWDERNDDNEHIRYHQPGERLCPDTYSGEGKNAAEYFVDFIKPLVNWASEAYQDLKQMLVDFLGDIFCGGDETCKDVLMMGLNAGLAALGVPPSLPNFDQLVDMGVDYLAAEIAEQITGTDLAKELIKQAEDYGLSTKEEIDQWVKERIKEGIQEGINALEPLRNPSCTGEEEAHSRGVEPLCLPPYVKSHLDPAGQFLPATAIVKITRKEDAAPTDEQLQHMALKLTVFGEKDVPPDYSVWVQHTHSWLPVKGPLQGELFKSEFRHIPPLASGESITLPIPLMPADYWAPGHKEAEGGWWDTECDDYSCWDRTSNDFWELYYRGQAWLDAVVGPDSVDYAPHSGDNGFSTDSCEAGPLPTGSDPYTTFCQP